MDYYLAIKISEIQFQAITWLKLENALRERSQSPRTAHCTIPFTQNVQNRQIHRDRKYTRGCLGLGVGKEEWELTTSGFMFLFFRRDKNVLKLVCGDGCTTSWIYLKHWIVYFKWKNCMVCELYLNNAIFKKGKIEQKMVWVATPTFPKVAQQKWLWVLGENKTPRALREAGEGAAMKFSRGHQQLSPRVALQT